VSSIGLKSMMRKEARPFEELAARVNVQLNSSGSSPRG